MLLVDLLIKAADAFEEQQVDFILIGGMAMATWIRPRLTDDCDLVVRIRRREQSRLKQALIAIGGRVTQLEIRLLFEKRWRRIPIEGAMLDVRIASGAHDRTAFENALPITFERREILVASPEDLALYKLQAWRGQDRLDLQALLHQRQDLNRVYIVSWLDRIATDTGHPMRERWAEALAMGPLASDPAEDPPE